MTLSDAELWARVQSVVDRHGRSAASAVAAKIEQLASKGNQDGVELWTEIGHRIRQLRGDKSNIIQ